jgi:hypothetical protein
MNRVESEWRWRGMNEWNGNGILCTMPPLDVEVTIFSYSLLFSLFIFLKMKVLSTSHKIGIFFLTQASLNNKDRRRNITE